MVKTVGAGVVLVGVALIAWFALSGGAADAPRQNSVDVRQGNLSVTVVCEGSFQPYQFITIRPRIESVERELTITEVVSNGTVVKKGDLLIAFDATELEAEASRLKIDVEGAESELIHAREEVNKAELDRDLNVRKEAFNFALAEKELEKYRELEGPRQIKDSEMKLKRAEAELEDARKDHEEALEMYQQDLVAGSEVKKAELRRQAAEFGFESARMAHDVLLRFTSKIDLQRLQQNREDAEKRLASIKPYMEALVSQRRAAFSKAERVLSEQKSRLEKKEKDIVNCRIVSPADGMVAYGSPDVNRWGGENAAVDLRVGNRVGTRQTIMYIPDLSRMSLVMRINEMDIGRIRKGQAVVARADAHPEIFLHGQVEKVGLMGSRGAWWDETVKFEVVCAVTETFDWFRPDLKAKIEVFIEELTDVIHVPIDAVYERNGKTICYREDGSEQPVVIGNSTADRVEIKKGLNADDRILLTKPSK